MTEAQWLASEDPDQMLVEVNRDDADGQIARKLRLFACGCCRRVWSAITDERGRAAVETAERFADGQEAARAMRVVVKAAWKVVTATHYDPVNRLAHDCAWHDPYGAAVGATQAASRLEAPIFSPAEVAGLVREVFGNPFRPASRLESCLTAQALRLAQASYAERELPSGHLDSARLAVLSDALEEAGCTNEAILSHLRSSGPHVRGCWALDLILGKQ
jgi:hypothetical protein